MNNSIDRLLFTTKPYQDESFLGYLIRISELNYCSNLNWILSACGLPSVTNATTFQEVPFKHKLPNLAKLAGVRENTLTPLFYRIDPNFPSKSKPRYDLYGSSIPTFYINHRNSRVCPNCLKQKNYLRKIWELMPATVCLSHQCLLIDKCPACHNFLDKKRTSIGRCSCGFDFRLIKTEILPEKELRLTTQIFKLGGLNESCKESQLSEPLNDLNLFHLLKTMFFFASFWAERTEFSGKILIEQYSNLEIHKLLHFSAGIFDDFPDNFYYFLDWMRYQNNSIFSFDDVDPRTEFNKPSRSRLELFGFNFKIQFDTPRFEFIHSAFEKYPQKGLRGYYQLPEFYIEPNILKTTFLRIRKNYLENNFSAS